MDKIPTAKIKWLYEGEDGAWRSMEGRFWIQPLYNHSTRPFAYDAHDSVNKVKFHAYDVATAKAKAVAALQVELDKYFGSTSADVTNAALRESQAAAQDI